MVMCMVLFVWGVHAATSVSLKITSTVGFTATNVYVDVLGQVKRGASVDTAVDLEKPDDIPDAIYTYHKQNFTPITEGENIGRPSNAVTTDSIPDWIVGQVRFTEEEPVVVYEIKFTNYGQFAIKVTLTEEQFNITGGIEKDIDNQATEILPDGVGIVKITLTLKQFSKQASVQFKINVDIERFGEAEPEQPAE